MIRPNTADSKSNWMRKILALVLGGAFLILGIIGLFIPILPGILFLLLALLCFAETSERLRARLAQWYQSHRSNKLAGRNYGLSRMQRIELSAWRAAARAMEFMGWHKR